MGDQDVQFRHRWRTLIRCVMTRTPWRRCRSASGFPRVILLMVFDRPPKEGGQVPGFNYFERDRTPASSVDGCLERKDLNLDHVVPSGIGAVRPPGKHRVFLHCISGRPTGCRWKLERLIRVN